MTLLQENAELDGPTPAWRENFENEDVQYWEVVADLGVPGRDPEPDGPQGDVDELEVGNDPILTGGDGEKDA